jgi:hypothetical protein
MTAWQTLTAHSTLPFGTAWQHLHALRSGVVINDALSVEIEFMPVDAYLSNDSIEAEVQDTSVEVVVDLEAVDLEVAE